MDFSRDTGIPCTVEGLLSRVGGRQVSGGREEHRRCDADLRTDDAELCPLSQVSARQSGVIPLADRGRVASGEPSALPSEIASASLPVSWSPISFLLTGLLRAALDQGGRAVATSIEEDIAVCGGRVSRQFAAAGVSDATVITSQRSGCHHVREGTRPRPEPLPLRRNNRQSSCGEEP
jgi:hypothetical protein